MNFQLCRYFKIYLLCSREMRNINCMNMNICKSCVSNAEMLIIYISRITGELVVLWSRKSALSNRQCVKNFTIWAFFYCSAELFSQPATDITSMSIAERESLAFREPVKHNENFRLKIYSLVKICVAGEERKYFSHTTIYGLWRAILLSFFPLSRFHIAITLQVGFFCFS